MNAELGELLPCPFCGGTPEIQEGNRFNHDVIVCGNGECGASMWGWLSTTLKQEWNTRIK